MPSKPLQHSTKATALAAASLGLASLTPSAPAAVTTWTGATGLDWNTDGNWTAGSPGSAAGQSAVFTVAPAGTVNVSATPANPIRGIFIGNGGGAPTAVNASNIASVSLTGAALTLTGNVETDVAAVTNVRTVFSARNGGGAATFTIGNDLVLNTPATNANSPRFNLAGANKALTLNGVISNGANTANGNNKGLAKDGDGTLTLTNAGNTYAGFTEVIAGTLVLGGNAGTAGGVLGVGTGAVLVGTSGTGAAQEVSLVVNGAYTVARDITVTNQASTGNAIVGLQSAFNTANTATFSGNVALGRTTLLQAAGSATADLTGVVTGSGTLIKTSSGTVRLSNVANGYTGATVVRNGTLLVAAPGSLGTSGSIALLDATSTAAASPSFLTTAGGTFTQSILSDALAANTGVNTVGADAGQTAVSTEYTGTVTLNRSLQVASSTDAAHNVTFSGQIKDGSAASGLTKTGTGTVVLTNAANTYTGPTAVTAGTLLVNGANTGGGAFAVGANATLGGTGSITGSVTADAGSRIAPGASIGQFTVANATVNGSLAIEIDPAASGSADVLQAAALVLGGTATIDFAAAAPLDDAAYVFATYATLDATAFNPTSVTGVPSGYAVDFNYNGTNALALVRSVPEPGLAVLGAFAIGLAIRQRR